MPGPSLSNWAISERFSTIMALILYFLIINVECILNIAEPRKQLSELVHDIA